MKRLLFLILMTSIVSGIYANANKVVSIRNSAGEKRIEVLSLKDVKIPENKTTQKSGEIKLFRESDCGASYPQVETCSDGTTITTGHLAVTYECETGNLISYTFYPTGAKCSSGPIE